jgi:hypothetical protein
VEIGDTRRAEVRADMGSSWPTGTLLDIGHRVMLLEQSRFRQYQVRSLAEGQLAMMLT